MTAINPFNTNIIYGDIDLTELFNFNNCDQLPEKEAFRLKSTQLANGNYGEFWEKNEDNQITCIFEITDVVDADIKENLKKVGSNWTLLSFYDKITGKLIESYEAKIYKLQAFSNGLTENAINQLTIIFDLKLELPKND